MFWKKTTSDFPSVEYETSDKRESFRLTAEIFGPVTATYKKREAQIINISAGGISFVCHNCYEGETGELHLKLPIKKVEHVSLPTKVIKITNETTCHCKFTEISSDEEEKIHQYVLLRQVEATRKSRTEKESTPEND